MRTFKRETYIRDLFSTRGLFNMFDYIEFDSLSDFFEALKLKRLELGMRKRIKVNLHDSSIPLLKELLEQTKILENDFFTFDITGLTDLKAILPLLPSKESRSFDLCVDLDRVEIEDLLNLIPIEHPWLRGNPLYISTTLTEDSYKNNLNSIVEVYMKTNFRHFYIIPDYESLSNLTFLEFEDLRYRLSDLSVWSSSSHVEQQPLVFSIVGGLRRVKVNDSKLYIDSFAQRDGVSILDLSKIEDSVTGEDLSSSNLSTLRAYLDIPSPFNSIANPYFNKKLTGSYLSIPPIVYCLSFSLGAKK